MSAILLYIAIATAGLLAGSFLNAWIWRTRHNEPISKGRSMCVHCRHTLGLLDLIPVVSFIFLRGSCRYCHKSISWQYPLVEIITAGIFVFFAYHHQVQAFTFPLVFVRDCIIAFFLIFTFVYDFLYMEICDKTTVWPAAALLACSLVFGWQPLWSMLIGIGVGAGFFMLQYVVSGGRWIGAGDIRLGAFMGVILGWPVILLALFLGYISGAAVSLLLIAAKKKQLASETPFGTYLVLATIISMVWGKQLVGWYVSLIGF